jgi:hypothetical protein
MMDVCVCRGGVPSIVLFVSWSLTGEHDDVAFRYNQWDDGSDPSVTELFSLIVMFFALYVCVWDTAFLRLGSQGREVMMGKTGNWPEYV